MIAGVVNTVPVSTWQHDAGTHLGRLEDDQIIHVRVASSHGGPQAWQHNGCVLVNVTERCDGRYHARVHLAMAYTCGAECDAIQQDGAQLLQ